MLAVFPHAAADVLEGNSFVKQLLILLHQQMELRACGERIQYIRFFAAVVRHVRVGGDGGSVIAAGNAAGDGGGEHLVGIAEGIQPILHAGAGRAGLALIFPKILQHGGGVQLGIVHIFVVAQAHTQRHSGNALRHNGGVGGGVGDQFIISHIVFPFKSFQFMC